jgi:hypothetical protein
MKTIMKYLIPVIAVATIATSAAKAGTLEEEVMPQVSTTTMKIGGSIDKGFGYFAKGVLTDQNGYFGLVDITKSLKYGFDAVLEFQRGSGMELTPRLGMQKFQQVGPFGVYAIGTHTIKGEANAEVFGSVSYARNIARNIVAKFYTEGLAGKCFDVNTSFFTYANAKVRVGVEVQTKGAKLEFGPAVNFSQGSKPTVGVQVSVSN